MKKEYLDKQKDESYKLINADVGGCIDRDWIEIPDGAEVAFISDDIGKQGTVAFAKGNNKEVFVFDVSDVEWDTTLWDSMNQFIEYGFNIVWQREKIEVGEVGRKFDSGKNRFSLLPKGAVNKIIDVLEFGAKKYDIDNWQQVENAKTRYYDATMRHIDLWWNGEKTDSETGVHHLAHAATNLLFLMWFDENDNS